MRPDPAPDRSDALRRAALGLLALGLFVHPLLRGLRAEPRASDCVQAVELGARRGHSAGALCGEAEGAALRGPARLLMGLPLELRRSDARSLEALPGIGPALARAIVSTRCGVGLKDPRDLVRVPGIGPQRLAGLLPRVQLDASAPPRCPAD